MLGANATKQAINDNICEAMDNLAMVELSKESTVEEMAGSIKQLTATNADLTKEVARLATLVGKVNGGGGGNSSSNGNGGNGKSGGDPKADPAGYCWTHG